jgi:hypothetical protein
VATTDVREMSLAEKMKSFYEAKKRNGVPEPS